MGFRSHEMKRETGENPVQTRCCVVGSGMRDRNSPYFFLANMPLFFGMFYNSDRASQVGTITYTAYDMLYHALKSTWSRSFKNMTAEAITIACCQEVGITPGNIIATGINIKKMLIDNESIFDTMLKAYNKTELHFGMDYIIPTPFDPRLKEYVASAVSKAAVDSGVSRMM